MRRLGADGPSYDTIVASGPDQRRPPPPRDRPPATIVEGDTVIIDVGALVDGYHSDMTRSFVVGEPTAEQQAVYDLVLEAQLAGLAAVRPGVAAKDVDAACRDLFAEPRLRRLVPPRHRSRRRARHPRGPVRRPGLRRPSCSSGTW